jgi:CheY-like chemotaxis protein
MYNSRDYLVARVEDTGIGIRSADIAKLFESFHQLDTRKNRGIMGTGLGLTITKQLLTMMNGFIDVESEYGKGSRFTLYIPLVEGDPARIVDTEEALPLVKAVDGTVALVVDDMPVNLTVASGFLGLHNIRSDTALSGERAIKMMKKMAEKGRNYDLVFMDHMMPDMDGIETVKHIRELEEFREVPIIALSANAVSGMKETFLEAGMNDFISKPINAATLNAVLARWLPPDKIGAKADGLSARKKMGKEKKESARMSGDGAADRQLLEQLRAIEELDLEAGLSYMGGSVKAYIDALRQFSGGLDEDVRLTREYLAGEDWRNYVTKVHGLKGVLNVLGAKVLGDWGAKLEAAGRDLNLPLLREETGPYCEVLLAFRDKLRSATAAPQSQV